MTTKYKVWIGGTVVAVWLLFWVMGIGVLVNSVQWSSNSRDCKYLIGVTVVNRIEGSNAYPADRCPVLKGV